MSSIAVSGMAGAQVRLQASAHNIANVDTVDFRRQEVVQSARPCGGVDTSLTSSPEPGQAAETDLVEQLRAKGAFLANLAVFRCSDRVMGTLFDAMS